MNPRGARGKTGSVNGNVEGTTFQSTSMALLSSPFTPIPKKGNAKECSNYCTVALTSHVSKVMLKIFQPRLQQYVK